MKDLVDSVAGIVGTFLELKMNSNLFEIFFNVLEVVLLLVQYFLLHLFGGADEGGVLVAGQPVPLEIAEQLEQD